MVVNLLLLTLIPICFTATLVFALERLLTTTTKVFWRRSIAANSLHGGICLLVFTFELAVFQRPYFAGIIVSAFFFFLVIVNNAKFNSLREPFIFQDFDYFLDAIKHPRLYLPFLGLWNTLIAIIIVVVSLYAGLRLEQPITHQLLASQFIGILTLQVLVGAFLLSWGSKHKLSVTLNPKIDIFNLGLVTSLWRYYQEERVIDVVRSIRQNSYLSSPNKGLINPLSILPNLLVVQSESFFDARQLFDGIKLDVLQQFDEIKTRSSLSGKLSVPAWGANTVRTEFAFLSGLNMDALGIHRFNPYRKLVREEFPTIASYLKNLGYRTICVHPYPASFYQRDRTYPFLGFDEFLDIRSFKQMDQKSKTMPYTSDAEVAQKVCELLGSESSQPLFIFVITMENHGPLHLEKVFLNEEVARYNKVPPPNSGDLTIYLRHLSNADQMVKTFKEYLNSLDRPSWLCWYGDHVPIMPDVYSNFGEPDGRTDYFIYGSENTHIQQADLSADKLGITLLQRMGLFPRDRC